MSVPISVGGGGGVGNTHEYLSEVTLATSSFSGSCTSHLVQTADKLKDKQNSSLPPPSLSACPPDWEYTLGSAQNLNPQLFHHVTLDKSFFKKFIYSAHIEPLLCDNY